MKAAVISGPQTVDIIDQPLPRPGPHQVLIKVQGCGVCASNIPIWEGRPWFHYPLEPGNPGHEGWGTIVETGSEVKGFKEGQPVTFLSDHAFAEYDAASVDSVVLLPHTLEGVPFPGEPLGCAANIFSRSDIHPGQKVAIIGIGFTGALLTALCVHAGAHVIAVSRREFARDTARRLGAETTLSIDEDVRTVVLEMTQERGCDRVIEAVGMQWSLDLASDLTAIRGRLIIGGYHQDGLRSVNMQQWNWRGIDVINAHERDPAVYISGIRAAIRSVTTGALQPQGLLTHGFDLEQLADALNNAQKRPDGFLKAYVRCG